MTGRSNWAEELWDASGALFDSIRAGLPDLPRHLHLDSLAAHLPALPSVSDFQSFARPSFSSFPQVPSVLEMSQKLEAFYMELPSLSRFRVPDLALPSIPELDIAGVSQRFRALHDEFPVGIRMIPLFVAVVLLITTWWILVSYFGAENCCGWIFCLLICARTCACLTVPALPDFDMAAGVHALRVTVACWCLH